jgi:phage-related protein
VGLGAEAFTILAVIEARDRASEIYERCGAVMKKFGGDVTETAGAVKAGSDSIDESLASTASGSDAVELASARVAAARDKVAAATDAQAQAEQRLLALTSQGVASEDEQAAAAENLAVAQQKSADAAAGQAAAVTAQRDALAALAAGTGDATAAAGLYADAQGKLRDASGQFVSAARAQEIAQQAANDASAAGTPLADALAAANDRVAASGRLVAESAAEAAEAQERQNALVKSGDVANAADALTKAEKNASSASKDLSAAQSKQAAVQKAVAASDKEATAAAEAQAAAQKRAAESSAAASKMLSSVGKAAGMTALGMGVAAGIMVKAAGDFQNSTTHLVTDAGESQKNLAMVQAGILGISTATGTSANDITNAMYHIESGGFHAKTALDMAKVAAEGAKVGGADLDTVSKTLVGTMNAYYGSTTNASNATQRSTSMMEQMIATVGSGDMRMQDLASSLSSVAPLAASAGISFNQVGAAIATMTAQGMTAQRSTQNLNNVIRNIVKPSGVASNEMRALGLNANQVSRSVGKQGLTGTLNEYTQAILRNSSGGMVTLGYMRQMTPAAQSLAQGILAGSISTGALAAAVKGLNPEQAALIAKFKTAATSATGLKQTYAGAMAALTGGATGLNVALMLTGKNAKTFADSAARIAQQGKGAAVLTQGWATIQGTFNYKLDAAKTAVENTGIAIGSALLPAVTAVLSAVTKILIPIAEWTAGHKTLTEILFVGVTALAATVAVVILAGKAFKGVKSAVDDVSKAVKGGQAALQKLGALSKKTSDSQAADAKKAAAAQEEASAESAAAQEEAAAQGAAAAETGAAETAAANEAAAGESAGAYEWMRVKASFSAAETATENEEAAATTSGSWIASAASTVAGWSAAGMRMVAQAAVWVAANTVKVAVVVAENIAGALATAGAWMAANLLMTAGIGLVILAVVAAVVLIIKHWSTIVDGVKKAWNAVYDFISKIISDVISFVKSHWTLIVGIITGPLGLAVVEIVRHWNQIKAFISKVVTDVIDFVKQHWRLIVSILGGPLGLAVALVTKYWNDIKHWFTEGTGKVLSILRGLAHDVVSVGEDVVRGIWNGISGMGGWLWGQVKSFASNTLHSFESALGIGSPSKYTTVHGQMLGLGLANGLIASIPKVLGAAHLMAGAVLGATSGLSARGGTLGIGSSLALSAANPAGGGGAAMTVNIDLRNAVVASDASMNQLAAKVGNQVVKQLVGAGYKTRLT